MFIEISSLEEYERMKSGPAMMAYFTMEACNACHAFKPKVEEVVSAAFPNIVLAHVKSDKYLEIAAQNRVFTTPTVLVFFEGREYIRKSRAFSVGELEQEIERIYKLLF